MSLVVLLDSGPLGSATNPRGSPDNLATLAWLRALLVKRIGIVVPEIADYELRRELLRAHKTEGIARLDALIAHTGYLPLTTEVMRTAAAFWAQARQRGRPTAGDAALDADMILAAQAAVAGWGGDDAIIATTNVAHLGLFADARHWRDIS